MAFTPLISVEHNNDEDSEEYKKFRHYKEGLNVKIGKEQFLKDWKIPLDKIQEVEEL